MRLNNFDWELCAVVCEYIRRRAVALNPVVKENLDDVYDLDQFE